MALTILEQLETLNVHVTYGAVMLSFLLSRDVDWVRKERMRQPEYFGKDGDRSS